MEYLYRVDRLKSARKLDRYISPAVWDGFPHRSLCEAQANLSPDEVIARISFWRSEVIARKRGFASMVNDHILIRVRRDYVERVFHDWDFEDDDRLPNQAWLLWSAVPKADTDGNFLNRGLELSHLEVFDSGRWVPWREAVVLRHLVHRLRSQGWQDCLVPDAKASLRAVAWTEERMPGSADRSVLLLAFDPQAGGAHLMSEPDELATLVHHIVASSWPRLTLPTAVLLVTPALTEAGGGIWRAASRVSWSFPRRHALARWARELLELPEECPIPTLEHGADLSEHAAESLLLVSGAHVALDRHRAST